MRAVVLMLVACSGSPAAAPIAPAAPRPAPTARAAGPAPIEWVLDVVRRGPFRGVAAAHDPKGVLAFVVGDVATQSLILGRADKSEWTTVLAGGVESDLGIAFAGEATYVASVGPALKEGLLHVVTLSKSGREEQVVFKGAREHNFGVARRMAVDATGGLHLCFVQTGGELMYARKSGGAWSTEQIAQSGETCSLALDPTGRPRVVYESAGVRYASRDGGWQVTALEKGADPVLVVDGKGREHVAFATPNGVKHATFTGVKWSSELVATAELVMPAWIDLAVGEDGTAHVAFLAREHPKMPPAVRYAALREGAWKAERIADATDLGLSLTLDSSGQPHVLFHAARPFLTVARPRRTGDCPTGSARAFSTCVALDPFAATSMVECARGVEGATWPLACRDLEPKINEVESTARARCEKDDRDACMLLARTEDAVVEGYEFELADPPCAKGKSCSGYRAMRLSWNLAGATAAKDQGRATYARACKLGRADACVLLADLVMKTSAGEAMKVARVACDAGSAMGCAIAVRLAIDAQLKDETLFVKTAALFAKGCTEGAAASCTNAGYMLATGRGVKRDVDAAATHFHKGCAAGRTAACAGLVYLRGQASFKVKADVIAATKKVADACPDEPLACVAAGFAFEKGIGIAPNAAKAKDYKKKACDAGLC